MKKFKKKVIIIILVFTMLIVIGSIWQNHSMKKEVKMYPPPGNLYTVNDHKMHLYGSGVGEYTIVFFSGSGTPCSYTDFYYLQKELSQDVRTVTFDRAGYGWSEPTDKPRDINTVVEELHELLILANESAPYILVAHSIASLEAIRYAQKYTDEIKGMVLLDGGNPYFYLEDSQLSGVLLNRFQATIRSLGIIRILGELNIILPFTAANIRNKSLTDNIQKIDKVMYYNKIGNKNNLNYINNMNKNAKTVIENGFLDNIPLYILSSENGSRWNKSQVELTLWSNISYHNTVSKANHYIHWSHNNLVIDRIKELLEKVS